MSHLTTMRDNTKTMQREALQGGRITIRWSRAEIDAMHAESPITCPAWGAYPCDRFERTPASYVPPTKDKP